MGNVSPETLLSELTRVERAREQRGKFTGPNRRQHVRHSIRGEATLYPVGRNRLNTTPVEIQLRDLARGGVGFVCPHSLPVDSNWRISFYCGGYVIGSQSLIVKHCTQIGEGLHLIGSQFVLDAGIMVALGLTMDEFDRDDRVDDMDDLESMFRPPNDVN